MPLCLSPLGPQSVTCHSASLTSICPFLHRSSQRCPPGCATALPPTSREHQEGFRSQGGHSILSPPRRAAAYTEGEQLPVPARLQGAPVSWLVQPQSRGPSHIYTPHSGMLTLTHTYSLPLLLTLPVHPPADSEYLTMLPHERSRGLANGTSWLASTVPSSCSPHLSSCPLHGHMEDSMVSMDTR